MVFAPAALSKKKVEIIKLVVLLFFQVEIFIGVLGVIFNKGKIVAVFMSMVSILMVLMILIFMWLLNNETPGE